MAKGKTTKTIKFVLIALFTIVLAVASYSLIIEGINYVIESLGLMGRFLPHIILMIVSIIILIALGANSKTLRQVVLRK